VAAGSTAKISCTYRSAKTGTVAVDVVVMGKTGDTPVAVISIAGFVADKTWLRSPADVAAAAATGPVLVDTRSAARFAALHIPRALNVPVFALKTRSELRTREVVLVDDGFEPAVLLAEASVLRAQGFPRVWVLDGGMAAWLRQGLAVEGTETAVRSLAVTEVTPAEFLRARSEGVWQAVGVGALPGANLDELFPAGIGYAKRPEDVDSALTAMPAQTEGRARARILVISAANISPVGIEAHLAKGTSAPLFYLRGGLAALETFQAQQIALAANNGQLSQTKTARRTPMVSGACGSCGK
jgi:rhodanese-related sulfurtransferase